MESMDVPWSDFDDVVEGILKLFFKRPTSTRVIYFDGWNGFGASAVLTTVTEALRSQRGTSTLYFDTIIHIDCSIWKNKRAMQRAIAEKLELDHSILAIFDKEDEEDDFRGVDKSSRKEIVSVAKVINETLMGCRFAMIFNNGTNDEIDMTRLGVPSFVGYSDNIMLWTFRRRFQDGEFYSEIQKRVKNTDIFAFESMYDITNPRLFIPILHKEAATIVAQYEYPWDFNQAVECCLYELFLYLSFHKVKEYDWEAHASNYWICDGIIQGDGAWNISNALHEEIRWEFYPRSKLWGQMKRIKNGFQYENLPPMLVLEEDVSDDPGKGPYRWVSITTRINVATKRMKSIVAKTSSYFLLFEKYDTPQVLPDDLFQQSHSLRVLNLTWCAFNFASPSFHFCNNLRFLGLYNCKHIETSGCEDNGTNGRGDHMSWAFVQSLSVLDLHYTEWDWILTPRVMDLMTNLRELNIVGARCFYMSHLRGRLRSLCKLRVIKTILHKETSDNDSYIDMTKLELLDLSGNTAMEVLPNLSRTSSIKVLVLDGCDGLEYIGSTLQLPPSLEFFSLDGNGPASNWAQIMQQPRQKPSPSSHNAKISKISLEGCTQLRNLFVRGLLNLAELDLSGTTIKILDFKTMVVEVPRLKRLFLLGCEHLRAIKWDRGNPKMQLNVLMIDTRGKAFRLPRPSFVENKSFQMHAVVTDVRIFRSLWYPINKARNSFYFHLRITSSTIHSGVDEISKQNIVPSDVSVSLLLPTEYGDIPIKVGEAPMQACPPSPPLNLNSYIEIGEGDCNLESEVQYLTNRYNLADVMVYVESLHAHDISITAGIYSYHWEKLRWCRVERCPKLQTVFPLITREVGYSHFKLLETFWASDLLMARCIWSKGFKFNDVPFGELRHIHLWSCPRLKFVLPLWFSSLPSLETLHILHCGDLRQVFVLDNGGGDPAAKAGDAIEFPKLSDIHLHELPMLQQICEVKMLAPALQKIKLRGCWGLRRLPAVASGGVKPKVECEKDFWDALEWDGLKANHDPSLFEACHSAYYKKPVSRGSLLR